MERTGHVKQAVANGEVVVACAYDGWVPKEVAAMLPAGFNAAQYVIAIEDGKIVDIRRGRPESVIGELFRKPILVDGSGQPKDSTCGPGERPAPAKPATPGAP